MRACGESIPERWCKRPWSSSVHSRWLLESVTEVDCCARCHDANRADRGLQAGAGGLHRFRRGAARCEHARCDAPRSARELAESLLAGPPGQPGAREARARARRERLKRSSSMSQVTHEFPADVPDQPELVSMRREDDLVWLTIERAEVMNCPPFPTLKRLRTVCETLREDLSIRVILLTGAGEKSFCAGADLKERKTMPAARVPLFVKQIRKTMDDIEALPQPTIAVVNGFALGGGMEL